MDAATVNVCVGIVRFIGSGSALFSRPLQLVIRASSPVMQIVRDHRFGSLGAGILSTALNECFLAEALKRSFLVPLP